MLQDVMAGQLCPLCGSTGEFIGEHAGYPLRICRCREKSAILLSWCWPSEAEYEDWYKHPSAYHDAEQRENLQKPYLERQQEHLRASCTRLQVLSTLYPPAVGDALLDVGCGDGMFVVVARERGYEAFGLEPNSKLFETARPDLAGRLRAGTWEALEGEYSYICLHDVFEHLTRPVRCLHRLREHLTAQGRLVLEMPEFDSPDQRRDGLNWRHIRPKQHVCLYNFAAAVALFEACGLELDSFYRPLAGSIGKATWILRKV